jgi:preprotein translocase subunit SecB
LPVSISKSRASRCTYPFDSSVIMALVHSAGLTVIILKKIEFAACGTADA